jgi:hypothetical protein
LWSTTQSHSHLEYTESTAMSALFRSQTYHGAERTHDDDYGTHT